jgi:hypothetical protein
MAGAIPTSVLSEALIHAIDGRTVTTAVFTTFAFEPGFFEEEILPVLFDQSFSHVPEIRKVQLEEKLRYLDHVAVYYDRQALVTGTTSANLDFARIAISRMGCFHPKMIFLLCDEFNDETEETSTSLLVAAMSANLTRAGWWDNVECAHVEEVKEGSRCAFRTDLLTLCTTIRKHEATGANQEAIQAIYKFLRYQVSDTTKRKAKRVLHPRIYVGNESFPEFLKNHLKLPKNTYNLEVVSPFFDKHNANTLAILVDTIQPKQTRVFLAHGHDGAAACSEDYFHEVQAMPNTHWSKLPQGITQRSNSENKDGLISDRYTHAKVYRLFSRSEDREYIVTGSVNLTRAAHSKASSGNLETAFVVDMGSKSHTRFWLSKIGDAAPSVFSDHEEDEEGITSHNPPPITLRYHWGTQEAAYYYDKTSTQAHLPLQISAQGEIIAQVDACVLNEWAPLAVDANQIERILRCTSFFQIAVDEGEPATLLVCEEGMAHKPSLLTNLSPEDILRYWSLLSAEQREAFLESKLAAFLSDHGVTQASARLATTTKSLFDGFAGIFHAFATLKEHIAQALDAGRTKDAECRLIGDKYDSLPVLLEKVIQDTQGDLVIRYITILTAQQLVQELEALFPEFFEQQADYISKLKQKIDLLGQLRNEFSFDSPKEQEQFFQWLEHHFLAQAMVEGAA